jgi:hypothetical protein
MQMDTTTSRSLAALGCFAALFVGAVGASCIFPDRDIQFVCGDVRWDGIAQGAYGQQGNDAVAIQIAQNWVTAQACMTDAHHVILQEGRDADCHLEIDQTGCENLTGCEWTN